MSEKYRVLIVDDDPAQAEMVREFLRVSGYKDVVWVDNIHKLWESLKERIFDIVLLDYKLPDGTGVDALAEMDARGYQLPVVMITGEGNERIAVQAIQRGAADYLLKSGDYLITLPSLIRKAVRAHQLQMDIQRSLEQIRYQATLLRNVRDAIVVWDMDGCITYWNPAACALFGKDEDERLGRQVSEIYLPTFSPPVSLPADDSKTEPHVVRQYIKPDGMEVWVSSLVTALRDVGAENRLIGFMDVSSDITRRVQAEQALRESEARYRAIVEDYQTELICRFKSNGTLTFVNEVFCRYFDKSRDELIGSNFLTFLPEDEQEKTLRHLASFGEGKSVATLEHQVILPDQELRWLLRTDRAIIDDQGNIFEFQSMGRDITERKQMEVQIRTAQAHLIQAARLTTIGEMAAGVAHQIYNPLTTIIADAQLLVRQLSADHPGRESAEAIEQAGWRLQQVVQNLMEFSRPATETLTTIAVNETIQRAFSLVEGQIKSSGCFLESHLSDGLPMVRGNSRQLEGLWVNLLLLARDASLDGKEHSIRVISRTGPSSKVVVEVCDNGESIPFDQLATIFEPNFIGPSSGRGTGMELSICREIVRQHGGHITAESVPERDTIFRVVLPAGDKSPPVVQPEVKYGTG